MGPFELKDLMGLGPVPPLTITSANTPKMDTLGAILDIPIFKGERVPVSCNALTPRTRPLQLLLLPSSEFSVRHETDTMRGFQTEVDLGKARAGRFSTDASAFWDLLDPPMRSRVIAAGFGDYATGLRRTQPRFPPIMRYALMERWNDCTHSFIFGFGEMTLTPADYTTITGLGFNGPVAPLDARYQTAALGAELVRTLLDVPTRTRYTAQGYVSYEVVYRFWAEQIRSRLAAWRELSTDARPAAPAYTREERDQATMSFIFYIISSQLLCTSQNKGDPAVLVCLRDLGRVGSYDWASLALAHIYRGLDIWTRGSGESNWQFLRPLEVWAYEYRIYPSGTGGDAVVDGRRIPQYLAHRHHTFSSSEDPHYWRCYLNDRTLADVTSSDSMGGSCLGGLSRSCCGRGLYPFQDPTTGSLGRPVFPGGEDLRASGRHGIEVSARCSSSPHVPIGGHGPGGLVGGERRRHQTPVYYRAQMEAEAEAEAPAGPTGAVLGDVPFPPGMEVALDPALGLGSAIIIPADLRQAPPPLQLDPEHATHVPAQRYQELYQRFGFARSYITRLYPELHERDLEIGRLRRHQSRHSSAVARLQMEVDRLRTRLEVEGIPLDFSEDEEDDDDGSSSDDVPPPPPSQAAAGPSRRQC
ncbi:hypothetical protein JCGZ_15567 [Jatropha curcas]|uniref:Aminotransferase-like plant mobile domain-containing protein n=1 Tax=Jatropha curcas TaxID=180498 RepID=A0A067K783_JATCU|nr:hypothetical protein JCGZ_15567 [Jatropha curcas]